MAIFPSELKGILNDFLHQPEWLLYPAPGKGGEMHHPQVHLWFGDESLTWNCQDVLNVAEVLGHDGKATTLLASYTGFKSLCYFLLKSQSRLGSAISKRSISMRNIFKPI